MVFKRARTLSVSWVMVCAVGCSLPLPAEPSAKADAAAPGPAVSQARSPRAQLTVLTWNLDWFQDPSEGPSDDDAQYAAVRDVLRQHAATLMALQEVASEAAFERLLQDLPSYAGALSGYEWKQRTALLWDRARFELACAHAVSGFSDAGRPPLELLLHDKHDDTQLLVVVIHAKAQSDARSYQERQQLASALADYLAAEHPALPTIVLGDFNDELKGSITAGQDTPYLPFTEDPRYATPTLLLNHGVAGEASYATGSTLDHIVLSRELGARVQAGSVNVLRDELLADEPSFTTRVSDHFPVILTIE